MASFFGTQCTTWRQQFDKQWALFQNKNDSKSMLSKVSVFLIQPCQVTSGATQAAVETHHKTFPPGTAGRLIIIIIIIDAKPPAVVIVRQNGLSSASCRTSVTVTPVCVTADLVNPGGGWPTTGTSPFLRCRTEGSDRLLQCA